MEMAARSDLQPPRVVRKRGKFGKRTWVGLFVDGYRYYLSPAEAFSLADRLVDAAEHVTTEGLERGEAVEHRD